MLLCMRTTVDLDDDILTELKLIAAETKKPLKSVMEDALRSELERRKKASTRGHSEEVVTYHGKGLRPGVNLNSTSELLDVMDDLQ